MLINQLAFCFTSTMNTKPMQTDDELVLLLRQDGAAAFETIYDRYWDKLYNSAYKRLHNSQVCEEIVQDVFTKLWQKHSTIQITTGLSNYLYTSVKYTVVDYYRKQLLSENYISSNIEDQKIDNSTEEHVFLNDLVNRVNHIVEQLPDKCRSVYQLSRVEHKTNKEIAVLLNISEKTVEGHLTKALSLLRLNLGSYLFIIASLVINK